MTPDAGDLPSPSPACPVCGSSSGRELCHENGFFLLRCPCGGMFLDRLPPAGYVDPTYDPHRDDFYACSAAIRAGWVRAHAPPGLLLEIGCGRGRFLAEAQRLGFGVAALEPEPDRAAYVRERLGAEVEGSLLEDSARPAASCDVVYHCDLLSHFPDPKAALGRMRAFLRPGGVMAFEVGIVGEMPDAWYRANSLRLPHHRWFYSEQALRRLMMETGFEIVAYRRFGMGPNFALSRLAGRMGLGGGATRRIVYSPELGSHLEEIGGHLAPEVQRQGLGPELRARAYAFVRYRVGALLPRSGPGTAFVAARPA